MEDRGARPNLRIAAESYARMGLLVFPLAPRSKTPLTPRGFKDASDSLDQVAAWWTQWPDANIGIATGEMSGTFVLDIDGPDGELALVDLEARHGALPAAPEVRTGKGRHLYFRHYPGARNSSGKLGPRIDTRGEGGYVVAPPSTHPNGHQYAWAPGAGPRDRRRPEVPSWLCDALTKRTAVREETSWAPSTERDAERSRRYCLGALESTHRELASVPEGTRNERLRDAAYSLGGYVPTGFLEEHEIRDALISACRSNGSWTSEESKCRDTLDRALRAGIDAPRDIPAPRPHPSEWAQPEGDERSPNDVVPMGPPPRKWKTAAEIVQTMASEGAPLPTYLETLDAWTRGGLRRGKLVAIGGAPGAGKTALALQLGHVFHDTGHPVVVYAADEGREGLLTRWGQQCGMEREDIEGASEPVRAALARHFAKGLVDFVDPDEATLDEAARWLLHRSTEVGMTGVLVVDSLQTCRVDGGDGLEPRQRIDAVVRAVKSMAKAGLLVIATSEVARSFYRSQTDRIDPLAAFKESGSIEYALSLGLVLQSVKGEVGQADVFVAKNRMGRSDQHEPAFRLRIDFARVTLTEIARATDGDGERYEAPAAADDTKVDQLAEAIFRGLLMAQNPITSRIGLYDLAAGKQALKARAVSRLMADGRITGGGGNPFRAVTERGRNGA